MGGSSAEGDLYAEYRREIEGLPLSRALRTAVFVLFVIQTVFILVDRLIYPEQFLGFLPVRLGLNVVLGVIYFWSSHRYPLFSSYVTAVAGGGMLLTVVHGTGGAGSGYYVGLVLLLFGMGVLAPLSGKQAGSLGGLLVLGYVGLCLVDTANVEWDTFGLHLFFLGAAAFGGTMSCALLDRMRFADFLQRREIERARDELKELDREKSRFTANIHHELRTPLTLTLAPLEAMLGGEFGEVSELQRQYLVSMHANAQRLLKLINNLLDLAKIEGEQLRIRRVSTRVDALAEGLVAAARPLAERKGVTVEVSGLEGLPLVHVDPDAFEKIFLNLLGNALKFTESGGRIEVHGEPCGLEEIHLVVSDTGLGIPPEQLGRIFDRFAQVDSSGTRQHEGTGIGLALVKELVELHGGEIWAESEGLGHGTRIHVKLPLGEADEDLETEVLETASGKAVSLSDSFAALEAELHLEDAGGDMRLVEMQRNVERGEFAKAADADVAPTVVDEEAPEVLIVEDNADMRRLLAHLIGQEFRVRVAKNGREGLERVRESVPDLVLTDVMMPEMTGTELCAAIKGDPALERVPVAIVTSKAEREMKIRGLELGADDYVTKPFHPRELMARVRGLVRVRRLQEVLAERNQALEASNRDLAQALLDLKQAEVQLVQSERLAAVGELAAGVAHEVNNPVNFAANALKTLQAYVGDIGRVAERIGELDLGHPDRIQEQAGELAKLRQELDFDETVAALSELVGIVTEGLDRTARLVGDLRDFAAPGEGPRGQVDLRRGLESTVQLIRHEFRRSGVEVEMDLATDVPTFEGDARALNQVFLNLLKNAAEALEGRGGTVRVHLCREEDSVLVEIQDDGPGVAPELQARLFEPFFTTKDAGSGTGLGLSISRRIVSEHGGRIDFESAAGRGTCFSIRLPLTRTRTEEEEGVSGA